MLRWIANPVLGLFCVLATILGLLTWVVTGPGLASARAEILSSGVFSDQDDRAPADPSDRSTSPLPANPFAGLRPPDAKVASVVGAPADPVVANVDGHLIYLSDLGAAVQALPEQLRKLPFEGLYPTLLDRMVDHEALVLLARRQKLDDDPKVKRQIEAATARVLEGALLERTAVPQVTEAAIQARYARDFANKPAVDEVHARHILVSSEDAAKQVISELNKGVDFATLAQRFSKDPDSARGGDLGFFRHDQVWPGFADLAFSLKPGEIAQEPIFNEFGWHVVQVLERRTVQPPSLAQAHDAIRKQLLEEAVRRVVAQARVGLRVHKFDMNSAPALTSDINAVDAPTPDDSTTSGDVRTKDDFQTKRGVQAPGNAATPLPSGPPIAAAPVRAPEKSPARAPQKPGN
jgi:peptidyl-prolyl cis-trans isomerase C